MVGTPPHAPAAPAEDEAVFAEVRQRFIDHQQSIFSVTCEYTSVLNGMRRECRYAREDDRLWHASAMNGADGIWRLPYEVAWDGEVAHVRPAGGRFRRIRDRVAAEPGTPSPEGAILAQIGPALSLPDGAASGHRYTLLSANYGSDDRNSYVDLRFSVDTFGGTFHLRLGRDVGYWPILMRWTTPGGGLSHQFTDLTYKRHESDGNVVYYPLTFRMYVPSPTAEGVANNEVLTVDEATLVLNEPVPLERFQLTPMPHEDFTDADTRQYTPAADRTWSPAGKPEFFPWDKFAESRSRPKPMVVGDPPVAPPGAGTVMPTGPLTAWRPYANPALLAGLLFVAIGVTWLLRQRRRAA